MWPFINATAELRVGGRSLRARTEASPNLNDETMLTLKAAPQDFFYGVVWDYFGGMGAGGTIQTQHVDSISLYSASSCEVCKGISRLLRSSALFTACAADLSVIMAEIETLSAIFNSTSLSDLLAEGWGFTFSWTVLRLVGAVSQLGFPSRLWSARNNRLGEKYLSFFLRAAIVGWPVTRLSAEGSGNDVPSFVNFDDAWKMLRMGERRLKAHFRAWPSDKHRLWWWLHEATERWLSLFLSLSAAWNSGGATSRDAPTGLIRSGALLRHTLDRVARAERNGWSVAVVAASVVEDQWNVRELELQVVPQKLSDVTLMQNGSRWTRAFKSNIPEEANFMIAFCLWPINSRARGMARRQSVQRVQCRIFSQSGVFSGCRTSRGDCKQLKHPVSSLRVRCAVPWDELLLPGQVSKLKLILESPAFVGSGRQPRVVVPVDFVLRELSWRPPRHDIGSVVRGRLAICMPPVYDYAAIEQRWGDLIGDWLEYHFEVLDIGHVFLYDNDGSLRDALRRGRWTGPCDSVAVEDAAKVGATPACTRSRILHYEPDFPARVYGRKIWSKSCAYCAENIAYDHCVINSRGLVDYVVILHGLDEWLVPLVERVTPEASDIVAVIPPSLPSFAGSALSGSANATCVSTDALQWTSVTATLPNSSSVASPAFDLAAELDSLQPFAYAQLFRANLHSFGTADQSCFGLIRCSLYRLASQMENFTDRSTFAPSSIFKPHAVTYVDTHFLSVDPKESYSVFRDGVVTLTNWRVNHYLDSLGSPRFALVGDDEAVRFVSGKPNSYENYTDDQVLLRLLLGRERSRPLRSRDARRDDNNAAGN
eukprot:TRINITY_DN7849_c0_g5_i1.p1 TRINITY_DN7849_c0_g5~~TRINITY_DN7849_c0_g5_i1.p1  ORF type:complete len:823 (-),score=96.12 TRINITY_DN7849_c0_g5_i1:272-2740(-)